MASKLPEPHLLPRVSLVYPPTETFQGEGEGKGKGGDPSDEVVLSQRAHSQKDYL